jgi:hypothetical protein
VRVLTDETTHDDELVAPVEADVPGVGRRRVLLVLDRISRISMASGQ